MKKFLIVNLFILLILTTLINTANAITVTEDLLASNINILNSILENKIDTNNPNYITEIVDDNGKVPAYEYYPSQMASRSIKTLKLYDGKIFMGLGDWNNNTGPVKVIYYDTVDGKIKSSGTINDEAIENFKIIDDTLYTTGCDPRDSWGCGSYYTYNKDENSWEQHLNNGGWVHVFNITKFKDKLYICGSTDQGLEMSTIQASSDNGETFENVPVYKDNTLLPYDSNLRCYNLMVYKDTLYAYIYYAPYSGFYQYDETNNRFDYISSHPYTESPSGTAAYNMRNLEYEIFKDKFIFVSGTSDGLYASNDLKTFETLKSNIKNGIRDIVVYDDTLYLLSTKTQLVNNGVLASFIHSAQIYSTKNLVDFNLLYEFTSGATPFSLEYYDNNIYVGTADVNGTSYTDVGALYKIDINNTKRSLSINKSNKEILISDGIKDYTVKYDLSDQQTTFKTSLTFNSNMTEAQCTQEYSKIRNLNLLFATLANIENVDIDTSTSYFNKVLSKNISSPSENYTTALNYAQKTFSTELNIQDKLFTITTQKINESSDEYSTEVTLTIKNNADLSSMNSGNNNTNTNINTNTNTNTNINTNTNNSNNNNNTNTNTNSNSNNIVNNFIENNNKLPQTGRTFEFKHLLQIIIIVAIIIIVILIIKENKSKKTKKE